MSCIRTITMLRIFLQLLPFDHLQDKSCLCISADFFFDPRYNLEIIS